MRTNVLVPLALAALLSLPIAQAQSVGATDAHLASEVASASVHVTGIECDGNLCWIEAPLVDVETGPGRNGSPLAPTDATVTSQGRDVSVHVTGVECDGDLCRMEANPVTISIDGVTALLP